MHSVENFLLVNVIPGNHSVTEGLPNDTGVLRGGKYYIETKSTGSGTIDLKRLGPDGSTWTAQITQITATAGKQTIDLPPGKYRWEVGTFTANYLEIQEIPYSA